MQALGRQAVALGLESLDLARIHERALSMLVAPHDSARRRAIRVTRARAFFAEAATQIERTHRAALDSDVHISELSLALRQRTAESSSSARRLKRTIVRRRMAEADLKSSEQRHTRLLAGAHRLQTQLRHGTREKLLTQEKKRQSMSHQLHDDIAQTLLGIHVRLLALNKAAKASTAYLKKELASTRRLVKHSASRVKRIAHELGSQHET
jgi:signal transduction histidine kinase